MKKSPGFRRITNPRSKQHRSVKRTPQGVNLLLLQRANYILVRYTQTLTSYKNVFFVVLKRLARIFTL